MRKSGTIIYKCRRCGESNGSMHHPRALEAIIYAAIGKTDGIFAAFGVPAMVSVHSCKDGHSGISDLVGVEYDKD